MQAILPSFFFQLSIHVRLVSVFIKFILTVPKAAVISSGCHCVTGRVTVPASQSLIRPFHKIIFCLKTFHKKVLTKISEICRKSWKKLFLRKFGVRKLEFAQCTTRKLSRKRFVLLQLLVRKWGTCTRIERQFRFSPIQIVQTYIYSNVEGRCG